MHDRIHLKFLLFSLLVFFLSNVKAANQVDYAADTNDIIFEMNLEELMNIEVTTASTRPQKLTETPTAVFVITQEDIRRSGATSIPEALRMALGVQVARVGTEYY